MRLEALSRESATRPGPLRVAVVTRARDPLSLRHAREYILQELQPLGVEAIAVAEGARPPAHCDLLWDPGLAGTRAPHRRLREEVSVPIVATVHGAGAFILSWRDIWGSRWRAIWGQVRKQRTRAAWRWFRSRASAVVAVSDFGRHEIARVFGIPTAKLHRIYPGIAPTTFRPEGERRVRLRPYLLHVAQHAPKKNVGRLLAAYARLPQSTRPELVVVAPGWPRGPVDIDGVQVLVDPLSHEELAGWYRGAVGLVFPSLHETFGLPIVEAMACGCPVITSNVTACPEVAGTAALLVEPRSVDAIARAMQELLDPTLQTVLRERGLVRARQFTWRATAERYVELFGHVARGAGRHRDPARRERSGSRPT